MKEKEKEREREMVTPAEVFPPGDFIKEELEARGWTQEDLAEILGRNTRLVNEIITGKRGITPETAKGLGDVFGTGAQFWMNLESAYRLSQVRSNNNPVAHRATIYGKAPVRHMIKRRWLEPSDNTEVLERRLLDFFQIKNLGEKPEFWAAARKSTSYETINPAQNAWLFRARHLTPALNASTFTETRFKQGLGRLRALLAEPQDIRQVPGVLAEHGIRLLIVEPLPQTRIDGACFWLNSRSPVVVLSLRYDRIDWFWHTLLHELGHVQNKDGLDNKNIPFDADLVGEGGQSKDEKPEFEKAADRFAVEFLIPQGKLDDFVERTRPMYSKNRIISFATLMGVHPGIVVGQLQYRGEISYGYHRDMLVKVRHIITEGALTDGWGRSL